MRYTELGMSKGVSAVSEASLTEAHLPTSNYMFKIVCLGRVCALAFNECFNTRRKGIYLHTICCRCFAEVRAVKDVGQGNYKTWAWRQEIVPFFA